MKNSNANKELGKLGGIKGIKSATEACNHEIKYGCHFDFELTDDGLIIVSNPVNGKHAIIAVESKLEAADDNGVKFLEWDLKQGYEVGGLNCALNQQLD